jgi:hypothetical protein
MQASCEQSVTRDMQQLATVTTVMSKSALNEYTLCNHILERLPGF